MKQNTSLEDERRALLDQIHSSREIYRRMLKKDDKPARGTTIEGGIVEVHTPDRFPRSMTMQWITRHPYMAGAAAAAAVALLGSRRTRTAITHGTVAATYRLRGKTATMRPVVSSEMSGTRRTARTRSTDSPNNAVSKPAAIAQSIFTGLATAAAMLLRDPRKMRAATNAFSAAAGYVRSRRSRLAGKRHAQVVHVKEG